MAVMTAVVDSRAAEAPWLFMPLQCIIAWTQTSSGSKVNNMPPSCVACDHFADDHWQRLD